MYVITGKGAEKMSEFNLVRWEYTYSHDAYKYFWQHASKIREGGE